MADAWFDNSSGDTGNTGNTGGSAGSFLDSINAFTGEANNQALEQAKGEAAALKASAKSGGFTVSPEAFQNMQKVLGDIQMRLESQQQNMSTLTQEPRLGSHPYGQQAARHDQQSATGDRGAQVTVRQFLEVLRESREALQLAAKNYQATEDDQSATFKGDAEA